MMHRASLADLTTKRKQSTAAASGPHSPAAQPRQSISRSGEPLTLLPLASLDKIAKPPRLKQSQAASSNANASGSQSARGSKPPLVLALPAVPAPMSARVLAHSSSNASSANRDHASKTRHRMPSVASRWQRVDSSTANLPAAAAAFGAATSAQQRPLRSLSLLLRDNPLGDVAMAALSQVAADSRAPLQHLCLNGNAVGARGAVMLVSKVCRVASLHATPVDLAGGCCAQTQQLANAREPCA